MAEESEIACNPVSSFQALKPTEERLFRDIKQPKATAFITNMETSDRSNTEMKSYGPVDNSANSSMGFKEANSSASSSNQVTCMCCGESHKCQQFVNKPAEDKQRFIFDNNLCFACLRRGHKSKECENKATCSICKTIVDQEVCVKTGAELEPVKLRLTTIVGKYSIVQSERASVLRVRGYSSSSFINLPPAYTRDFIPSNVPTFLSLKLPKGGHI